MAEQKGTKEKYHFMMFTPTMISMHDLCQNIQ